MKYQSSLLKRAAYLAAFAAILLELFWPVFANTIKYPVLGLCLLIIGIPHGSIDHIVTSKIYNLSFTVSDQIKFYLYYFVMMAIMVAIWIYNPLTGFLLFALMTVYHFGQADLEYLDLNESLKRILFLSRGTMIVGLIIFSEPAYTSAILENITGTDIIAYSVGVINLSAILAILILQHFIIQTVMLIYENKPLQHILRITFDAFIVSMLYLIVNPILAFSVYFGLWHSAGHVQDMINYLKKVGNEMNLRSFYLKSLPLNLISLVAIGLLFWLSDAFQYNLKVVSLLFIAISVLTLPHMLIVEKMFAESRKLK